jgi:hypothetical protein
MVRSRRCVDGNALGAFGPKGALRRACRAGDPRAVGIVAWTHAPESQFRPHPEKRACRASSASTILGCARLEGWGGHRSRVYPRSAISSAQVGYNRLAVPLMLRDAARADCICAARLLSMRARGKGPAIHGGRAALQTGPCIAFHCYRRCPGNENAGATALRGAGPLLFSLLNTMASEWNAPVG